MVGEGICRLKKRGNWENWTGPSSGLSATFSAKEKVRRSFHQRIFLARKSFPTRIFYKPKHHQSSLRFHPLQSGLVWIPQFLIVEQVNLLAKRGYVGEKTFHRWRSFDIGCLQCSRASGTQLHQWMWDGVAIWISALFWWPSTIGSYLLPVCDAW